MVQGVASKGDQEDSSQNEEQVQSQSDVLDHIRSKAQGRELGLPDQVVKSWRERKREMGKGRKEWRKEKDGTYERERTWEEI